jgi:hypothetical protein
VALADVPRLFCAPIPMHALTPLILRKSRMRKRARTDLCGGRSVMVVPTATAIPSQKSGWGKRSFVEGRLRSHLCEYRLNEAARLQLPRSMHSEALSVVSSEKGIFNSNRDG